MRMTITAAALLLASSVHAQDWGKFSEPLNVELIQDKYNAKLLDDFTYTGPEPDKIFWLAPKGFITDGASIPRIAWSIIGGPFEGQYRKAAIIHDVACVKRTRSWQVTHRAFYTGMRAAGVSEIDAKIMYAAVYHFGPRWAEPKSMTLPRTNATSIASQIEKLNTELPLGKKAVLIDEGRIISRTISTDGLQKERVEEVIGAVVEVREVQPALSKEAFEKMKFEIQQKNLSLVEIERLPQTTDIQ